MLGPSGGRMVAPKGMERQMVRLGIAFALAVSFVVSGGGAAVAGPVTVDCGGGDSLQAAINVAHSETPLEIIGVCHEQVVIDRPLTIIGGSRNAAIDGSGASGNTVTIRSDAVFIRNVRIQGAAQSLTAPDDTGHGVYAAAAFSFSLLGVTVRDNQGAGIMMYDSYLTIANSRVRRNGLDGIALLGGCCGIIGADSIRVNANGGDGIFSAGDQTLVLTNSRVNRNGRVGINANEDAYIADSVIRHNLSDGVASMGTGRIVRSRVANNGGFGIGYLNEVVDTTVARNGEGGVAAGSGATVSGSLITGNLGSALVADRGPVNIVNSTVRRNTALTGAAFNVADTLEVVNVTILRNSAPDGVFANSGTVNISGSIVHAHAGAADDCTGAPITSGGYNVVTGVGCTWAASDVVAAPRLLPLADNGGPTRTHALRPASPAIDAIPAAACQVTLDQRGEPRPAGPGCDSGAFEVQ